MQIDAPPDRLRAGLTGSAIGFHLTGRTRMSNRVLRAAALAVLVGLGGCAMAPKPASDQTLYERLGGKPAIIAVVDEGIANIAADTRINQRFANSDIPRLKTQLVDLVCANTGGPCRYTGRGMGDVHDGMNIRDAEFDALVEDLVKSLDKYKVPAREQGELLAILGRMRNAVVGH
jgi:hemoglobin